MSTISDRQPLINPNPPLQEYYASFESRIGYRIVLGGSRHFGYYDKDTYWPFPINGSLRAMEDHLFNTLGLKAGSEVLDAGCGYGEVASHMARRGLRVQGIDIVDRHIRRAQHNVQSRGLADMVTVQKMDYHHLEFFEDKSFEGVYTVETFVHATDPEAVLAGFMRVLKPGGSIALYEYDHNNLASAPKDLKRKWEEINKYSAMPTNDRFEKGVLERMLEEAGFEDIKVQDLTTNVTPMLRLFFLLALLPYLLVKLFGLEAWFINTVAGVEGYRSKGYLRYVAVSAKKPATPGTESTSDIHERKKNCSSQ